MIETVSATINTSKEVTTLKLKEAELLEIKEGKLLKDSPILNTLDEINNSSLETLKLKNEVDSNNVEKIKTINSNLEGKKHPESGVPYEKDVVELPDGRKIEGVFPVFESLAEIELPEELYKKGRDFHNNYCNEKLLEHIENDPELKNKFTEEQIEQLKNGGIDGMSWHHHQKPGLIQLVDTKIHTTTNHTGGISIWGYKSN